MMMLSTTTTTLITQVTGLIFFRGIGCGSVEFEDFISFFFGCPRATMDSGDDDGGAATIIS